MKKFRRAPMWLAAVLGLSGLYALRGRTDESGRSEVEKEGAVVTPPVASAAVRTVRSIPPIDAAAAKTATRTATFALG